MPTQRVGDVDLYYETSGNGPPVLLIHGLGSSAREWEPQIPALSPHYQVVAFDVRGHGRSGKPPGPYSIPLFAADAAGLIRALDLAPAHVVGISMGGTIALQLALSSPELVHSLVIVNSTPDMTVRTLGDRLWILQRLLSVRLLGMPQVTQLLAKRLFPRPDQAAERQHFVERWAEIDPRAYADAMRALVGWSVVDQLDAIRCRALLVSADHDVTPVAAKEAAVARMRNAELVVIEDSGHATLAEQPEALNAAVLAFLARQA